MSCPKCQHTVSVKNGHANGKPRRQCKSCGCNYTQSTPRGKSPHLKRRALQLYLEGVGFRGIARLLQVSNVSVMRWIRALGQAIEPLKAQQAPVQVDVMELDEMWHFVSKKNANAGSGWLLIDTEGDPLILSWETEVAPQDVGSLRGSIPSPVPTTPPTNLNPTRTLSQPTGTCVPKSIRKP